MSDVWSAFDEYFNLASGPLMQIWAWAFWRPADRDDPWYARGIVEPFQGSSGGLPSSIGFTGDLTYPDPNFAGAFHPIHLTITEHFGPPETTFDLKALPNGEHETFDDAWQAAPNCAYMAETTKRGALGAVVTLDYPPYFRRLSGVDFIAPRISSKG